MAGSKVPQFVLLISFVIFSTHALRVLFSDGKDKGKNGFKYETKINFLVDENGWKYYNGCSTTIQPYTPRAATTDVIVYIKSYIVMKKNTLRVKCRDKRAAISKTLSEYNHEILYLGVNHFTRGDEFLVSAFLLHSINLPHFQIYPIGEKALDVNYRTPLFDLIKYQENINIFGGNLIGQLRSLDE